MTAQASALHAPLGRRTFLRGLGVGAAAIGSTSLWSSQVALAADGSWDGPVLVVLSLRGGMDGLSAVAPVGDADYVRLRPRLAIPGSRALPTGDRRFGLHPALAPLLPLWKAGTAAAVQAVGTPDGSRSHFQATVELERAAPGTSVRTGWLDRVLGLSNSGDSFQAVHLGSGSSGQLLAGPAPAFAARSLADVTLASLDWVGPKMTTALQAMHGGSGQPTEAGAVAGLQALSRVSTIVAGDAGHRANYPAGSDLGAALRDAGVLIRANVGVRAITIDVGDWDLHADLGAGGDGNLAVKLADLAAALAAFAADLGSLFGRVTVVTLSEFGRRAAENGSGGADHGHGNAVLLLGGGLQGGQVHGAWPGLTDKALDQGDLAGATDYRNILAEFLVRRSGVSSSAVSTVFPGLTYSPVGAFS